MLAPARLFRQTVLYLFLALYALISLFPMYFALVSSFKTTTEIFSNSFALPTQYNFDNYVRAWELANVGTYFFNSVLLAVGCTALLGIVGAMASYILARFRFPFSNTVFVFFVMGMMIPVHSTIIPLAFNIGTFGLRDNMLVLILVTSAFSLSMTIFIVTGFMKSVPGSLEESAVMDGCTHWQVFTRIVVPLSMPALATASVFNFLGAWNNLLFPLLFISSKTNMPLSYGLLAFFGERRADYGGVMAAIVITILPPLIAYVLLQEKVEKGLTAGAVKG